MGTACAICGWPGAGATCDACASPRVAPTPLQDRVHLSILAGPQPEDYPTLRPAFLAWRNKDYPRMIGQCLIAMRIDNPKVVPLAQGHGWAFAEDSAAVYIVLDRDREELSIESPMLKLPSAHRIAAMRQVLEMNARVLGAARFCLRDDLVVLRFSDRLASLSPPKVVDAIREVALRADLFDDILAAAFDAAMVGPEARRQHLDFSFLGEPRDLPMIHRRAEVLEARGPSLPVPEPPAPPSATALVQARLDANEALCETLRRGLEILQPLAFLRDLHPATLMLVQRAILVRALHEHAAGAPHAIGHLFELSRPAIAKIHEAPVRSLLGRIAATATGDDVLPPAPALTIAIERVLRQRGVVDPRTAPAELAPFASAIDAKAHLRRWRTELDKAPDAMPLAARREVLASALLELALRAPLAPDARKRIEAAVAAGRRLSEPEAVTFLEDTIARVLA